MTCNDSVNSLTQFVSRGITPKYTEDTEDSIVVLNQKCIRDFKISFEPARRSNLTLRKVPEDKLLKKYDVVINSTGVGTLGRVAQYMEDFVQVTVDSHVTIVRPHYEAIDPLYFGYLIKAKQEIIESLADGSTGQTELSRDAIKELRVDFLEDIENQKKIGLMLLGLDQKIDFNRQINQTLESMAQAIFKSWFVDIEPVRAKILAIEAGEDAEGITRAAMRAISGKTDDELDHIQANQPENYAQFKTIAEKFPSAMQDSELGDIPEGWKIKQIQDLAKTIKGKSYKSSELAKSKIALVTLKSFNKGGGYRLDGLKEYTGSYKAEQEVLAGDLIIAYTDVTQAADVIGKPAMVVSDSRYEHLIISLDVAVVRPHIDDHKYFLYGIAMTDNFQNHTKSYTTGTTVLHLGKSAVPEFRFPKPSDELLKLYEQNVSPIFKLVDENIEENRNLKNLRDKLLPKLLSGELSVDSIELAEAES